jgi:hypothetical protein
VYLIGTVPLPATLYETHLPLGAAATGCVVVVRGAASRRTTALATLSTGADLFVCHKQ